MRGDGFGEKSLSHSPELGEAESAESQGSRNPTARFGDRNHFTVQIVHVTGPAKEGRPGIGVKGDLAQLPASWL